MARRVSRRLLARYVADGVSNGDHGVIERLAAYLLESRRTDEASLIIHDAEYLLSRRGTVVATVTSAYELTDDTLAAIKKMVTEKTQADRVELATAVDESLIGGYKVAYPGHEIDETVRHQIATLQTRLKKA